MRAHGPAGRMIALIAVAAATSCSTAHEVDMGSPDSGADDLAVADLPVCGDADGDGAADAACGGTDCNDGNADVRPGAVESCDAIDDDCDGAVDEGCVGVAGHYVKATDPSAGYIFGLMLTVATDGSSVAISAAQRAAYVLDAGAGGWTETRVAMARFPLCGRVALSGDGAWLAAFGPGTSTDEYIDFYARGGAWARDHSVLLGDHTVIGCDGLATSESGDVTVLGRQFDAVGAAATAGQLQILVRDASGATSIFVADAANPDSGDNLGESVAVSRDGTYVAAGAPGESSGASGVGGDQTSNSVSNSGAAYVFRHDASGWTQMEYFKSAAPRLAGAFGTAVALSRDGDVLVVGAPGDLLEHVAPPAAGGRAYVFRRAGTTWSLEASLQAVSAAVGDRFGTSVALSGDGSELAVGAFHEDSGGFGLDGRAVPGAAPNSGAVYVFVHDAGGWHQRHYVKATNVGSGDRFGETVALSADGHLLVCGAPDEDSAASGIDGDGTDDSLTDSGAAYTYAL